MIIFRAVLLLAICFEILADFAKSAKDFETKQASPGPLASVLSSSDSGAVSALSTPSLSSPTPSLRFVSPREGGVVTLGAKSVVDLEITGVIDNASANSLSGLYICLDVDAESAKRSVELWPEQREPTSNESFPSHGQLRLFRKSFRPHCFPATLHLVQFLRTSRFGTHQMFSSLEKWELFSSASRHNIPLSDDQKHQQNLTQEPLFYVDKVISKTMVTFQSESSSSATGNFGRLPYMLSRTHCSRFTHFKFLLYPQQWLPSTQAASIYYTLLSHPLRTDDPSEACVLIGLSDVKAANQNKESLESTASRLTRLPLWGNGENHIVFHYGDYSPGFDIQRAIVAASSFSHGPPFNKSYFNHISPELIPELLQARSGFDIEMPMAFYRCGYGDDQLHLKKFSRFYKSSPSALNGFGKESLVPSMDTRERPLLLTFKGALYDMPLDHPAHPRRTLRSIHNGRDVIIALHCWSVAPDCSISSSSKDEETTASPSSDFSSKSSTAFNHMRNYSSASSLLNPECFSLTQEAQSYDFETLMLRSRFAAVLPGEGTHSYRLYEALQAGSIPVLLGRSARPLDGLIKWEDIAVLQEDTSALALQYLEARLRLIPTSTLTTMQRRGRNVFDAHFSTLTAQMSSMFALLAHRFDKVNKAIVLEAEEAGKEAKEGKQSVSSGTPEGILNLHSVGRDSEESNFSEMHSSNDNRAEISSKAFLTAPHSVKADAPDALLTAHHSAKVDEELKRETALSDRFLITAEKDDNEKKMTLNVDINETHVIETSTESVSRESNASFRSPQDSESESQQSITQSPSRLSSYSHLLVEGSKAVTELADAIGPIQRLELSVLHLNSTIFKGVESSGDGDHFDIDRARLILDEVYTNLTAARLQLYKEENLLSSLSHATITPHIKWLYSATPSLFERSQDHVRPAVANIHSILNQVYGIAGEWRHAATSVHMLLLHYGAERGSHQQDADTKRARNTLFDLRRSTSLKMDTSTLEPPRGRLLDVLSDLDGLSETSGGFGLRGWGSLAHFTGPAPLVSVGENSLPFPIRSSSDSGSFKTHPSIVFPSVLLTAKSAQSLADDTPLQKSLQLRLHAFMRENNVMKSRAHSLPLRPRRKEFASTPSSSKNASIAIVSLCSYPKGSGNLTELSMNNLKAYCEHHGYDCFIATSSLDPSRPTAWSKVLLVTHFLPKYEWVMWKDCDTFVMNRETTVEDILVSAAKAREVIGKGVGRVLQGKRKEQRVTSKTHLIAEDDNDLVDEDARKTQKVSTVSTVVFSSNGSVVETISSVSRTDANNSTEYSTVAKASSENIINRAKSRIASKQQDLEGDHVSPDRYFKNDFFDESMCQDALPLASSPIDLIVSEDGLMLNTGVWIIRRSLWSLGWLQRIYGVDETKVNSSFNSSSTLFPFDFINVITGGEAESLVTPSTVADALKRMRSNVSHSILTTNRMWEQGGALWQFVNRNVPYSYNEEEARSVNDNLVDARLSYCKTGRDRQSQRKQSNATFRPLIAYEDLLHTQFVPQAWINSYPEAIAGVLRDHKGSPMHASYQKSDWLVSFSGCKGYFGEQPCEDLYAAFGIVAVGGSEYAL